MKKTRIMVFGTFDGLHKGHLEFFQQAKNLAPNSFLIVSIARDVNVKRIKGKKPDIDERGRKKLIESCGVADRVVLAGRDQYLAHILKENPDIIALGYDQSAYVPELKKDLLNKGIDIKIKRLKPYQENIFKNSLIKKKHL